MKKPIITLLVLILICFQSNGQLIVSKLIGQNSENTTIGGGLFLFYNFPIRQGNQRTRTELMDLAYFPSKNPGLPAIAAYICAKSGYKYLFSETNTGFYIKPQVKQMKMVMA